MLNPTSNQHNKISANIKVAFIEKKSFFLSFRIFIVETQLVMLFTQ